MLSLSPSCFTRGRMSHYMRVKAKKKKNHHSVTLTHTHTHLPTCLPYSYRKCKKFYFPSALQLRLYLPRKTCPRGFTKTLNFYYSLRYHCFSKMGSWINIALYWKQIHVCSIHAAEKPYSNEEAETKSPINYKNQLNSGQKGKSTSI